MNNASATLSDEMITPGALPTVRDRASSLSNSIETAGDCAIAAVEALNALIDKLAGAVPTETKPSATTPVPHEDRPTFGGAIGAIDAEIERGELNMKRVHRFLNVDLYAAIERLKPLL